MTINALDGQFGQFPLPFLAINVDENPACGVVDGDEKVATRGLVRHPRQIVDGKIDEAPLLVLLQEGDFI